MDWVQCIVVSDVSYPRKTVHWCTSQGFAVRYTIVIQFLILNYCFIIIKLSINTLYCIMIVYIWNSLDVLWLAKRFRGFREHIKLHAQHQHLFFLTFPSVSELLMGEVDSSTLLSLPPTERSRVSSPLTHLYSCMCSRQHAGIIPKCVKAPWWNERISTCSRGFNVSSGIGLCKLWCRRNELNAHKRPLVSTISLHSHYKLPSSYPEGCWQGKLKIQINLTQLLTKRKVFCGLDMSDRSMIF